jgi:hypothetical protein
MQFLNIHTYHSRFVPEGVAHASEIFLPDAQILPKLLSYEEYCKLQVVSLSPSDRSLSQG